MKNKYYVIRAFRDGRHPLGYRFGTASRFKTLAEAEENAILFTSQVLPAYSADRIIVGEGAIRNGYPTGKGKRLMVLSGKN